MKYYLLFYSLIFYLFFVRVTMNLLILIMI